MTPKTFLVDKSIFKIFLQIKTVKVCIVLPQRKKWSSLVILDVKQNFSLPFFNRGKLMITILVPQLYMDDPYVF